MNDWKQQLSALALSLPRENEVEESEHSQQPQSNQNIISKVVVRIELCKRAGKLCTLLTNNIKDEPLPNAVELARVLKKKLAVGGSERDGEILLQGDVRAKTAQQLLDLNYKIRKINF